MAKSLEQESREAAKRLQIDLPEDVKIAAIKAAANDYSRDLVNQARVQGRVLENVIFKSDTPDHVPGYGRDDRDTARRELARSDVMDMLEKAGFNMDTQTFSHGSHTHNTHDVVEALVNTGRIVAGNVAAANKAR